MVSRSGQIQKGIPQGLTSGPLFFFTRVSVSIIILTCTPAPATYARLMNLVLSGVSAKKALQFLDDILVFSKDDFDTHLNNLQEVLEAHLKAGLKLKPTKCQLFQSEVEYLGHLVSKDGLRPVKRLTEEIRQWQIPTNRAECRVLLGKLGYYRHFVQSFARKAEPLLEKLRMDGVGDFHTFKLTPQFKTAVQQLKDEVANADILGHPDWDSNEMFTVDTDYSQNNRAIGGVLSQRQNGREKVLAYGSKRLTKSQSKYHPFVGELCAMLHFLRLWKYYLLGRRFKCRVDNTGLLNIHKIDPPDNMTARWLATLANYDFIMEHRGTKSHGNADGLSRRPNMEPADGSTEDVEDDHVWQLDGSTEDLEDNHVRQIQQQQQQTRRTIQCQKEGCKDIFTTLQKLEQHQRDHQAVTTIIPPYERWTEETWLERQDGDTVLSQIKEALEKQNPPSSETIRASCPETQTYLTQHKNLKLKNGILYYQRTWIDEANHEKTKDVVLVPKDWQNELMKQCHETTGHARDDTVVKTAQKFFYFNNMYKIAQDTRRECEECQTSGAAPKLQNHTLRSVVTGYPFQSLSCDYVGPLPPSKNNNRYLFTVVDRFSRYLTAYPVRHNDGVTTLKKLEEFISNYSVPESIHSDRGSHFLNRGVQEAAKELGINWTVTPSYHPCSNPIERQHRTLNRLLKTASKGFQRNWEDHLPTALFQMRTMKSTATGYTPFELVFGRQASLPLQLLYEIPSEGSPKHENYHEYLKSMKKNMCQTHEWARKNMKTAVERQRRNYYGKNVNPFAVNDKVWLFTPSRPMGVPGKLYSRYWTGPWTISKFINDVVVQIEPHTSWFSNRSQVVSISRIKRYYSQETDERGHQLNIPPVVNADLQLPGDEAAETLPLGDSSDEESEPQNFQPRQPQRENEQREEPGLPEQEIAEEEPGALVPNRPVPNRPKRNRAQKLEHEAQEFFGPLPSKRLRGRNQDEPRTE